MLLERGGHLASLEHLLADCFSGKGRVALLEAPVGCGRSALLGAFAERAARAGATVLTASCSSMERRLPLGVVGQLLHDQDLSGESRDRAARLLQDGAALSAPDPGVRPGPDRAGPETARVYHGILRVFSEFRGKNPLVLAIDDIHNSDDPSLSFLLYFVRRMRSARAMVVCTDLIRTSPGMAPIHAEFRHPPYGRHLRLSPLSDDSARELAVDRLGVHTAAHHTDALIAAGGGNPRLLRALLDDLAATGAPAGDHYRRAVLRCLHRGGPLMTDLARAVAVLGPAPTEPDPGALVDADPALSAATLQAMTAAGLLGDRGFRHREARSAVLADLPSDTRARLHHRAALRLNAQGAAPADIARHLIEAGPDPGPWALDALCETAEHALAGGDPAHAVACLETAHRACAGRPGHIGVTARLARAQWHTDPSAAARHLPALAGAARAGRLDPHDGTELVRQLLWQGRGAEAAEGLDLLRASAAGRDHRTAIELHALDSWLSVGHPPLARATRWPRTAIGPRPQRPPGADTWLLSAGRIAGLLRRDHPHDAARWARTVLAEMGHGRVTAWSVESALLAVAALLSTDSTRAVVAACERIRSSGAPRPPDGTGPPRFPVLDAVLHAACAEAALREGDLGSAARDARAALDRLPPRGWGIAAGLPIGTLVLALTRMGDHSGAAALVARPVPDDMFHSRHGVHYLYARGHHHLGADRPNAALADFLSCGELVRRWGVDLPGLVPWRAAAAESWQRLGNQHQARRLAHEQLTRLGPGASRARGLSLRVLAAGSPMERRPQLLAEAVDVFEECGDRLELARAIADLSRAHHALGQRKRARMMVRRAWQLARMCEASPLCLGTFPDPDSVSVTVPTPAGSAGISSLTGSERRVAALAVVGYTNREIAAKLFITPSTVEQHLTRVYRKLDVQHRRDLPTELHADLMPSA
ncbi:AAA family ATPase [Nocardiopsis mangrovi]|uniref:AAA family ATPase n=1 Tax=Nocardiopsis mangrovi TaxID=1179818 RepID=A0ABV9E562_9ACTN